jgi:hypothetical protein
MSILLTVHLDGYFRTDNIAYAAAITFLRFVGVCRNIAGGIRSSQEVNDFAGTELDADLATLTEFPVDLDFTLHVIWTSHLSISTLRMTAFFVKADRRLIVIFVRYFDTGSMFQYADIAYNPNASRVLLCLLDVYNVV